MFSAEPLPHFVDDYLTRLYERHPTSATFDGVHAYDDLLEDLSRAAIDAQIRELNEFGRRLAAIDPAGLTPVERLERPVLDANIRGRLLELEEVRSWERNPQHYMDLLAASLAGQVLFEYAPASERARRVLSKLRQTPRFVQTARENVKDPPGIFVKVAVETLRGLVRFIEEDLPHAFADLDDLHLLGDLVDASAEATAALRVYADYLEQEVAPRARGSFRLGRRLFEEKLRLDEGIEVEAPRLLAIALRELRETQEQFRRVAARIDGGDPVEVWRRLKDRHPAPGELVGVAREQVRELLDFVAHHDIVSVPDGDPVAVAPTPRFYRWTAASMWTPGPFELRPLRAYYYLTDADPAWPADRQREHMRDFNFGALWAISIHEVYPGHFVHYQHLRRLDAKLRKSLLFAATSVIEGWAHYAEQMMLEEGFGADDEAVRLGQLAEALVRLCRTVVGVRLHTEDLSVEQGVRFFREEAFLEEAAARREAERGTFDPAYVVYALGRLAVLRLRDQYRARLGSRFSLRAFHDALLGNGAVPFTLHRRLLLGEEDGGPVVE
ncbi:MAG TPA: DUF885 domain-containing protein [Vicinamibacterales bacterium]|nr:DUF885 domain-containing protein [Vicinamibacterales bacterium]